MRPATAPPTSSVDRRALRVAHCLLVAWLLSSSACATVDHGVPAPASAAVRPDAPAGSADVVARQIAPGVYLLPGDSRGGGDVDTVNQGRIGNAGFIVGPTGVLAIDTGTSYRHGRALLAAIARVTDRPVRLALITHARQEFLFGAAAFRERGIPLQMHARAATLMTSRCEGCLKTLRQTLGDAALDGTRVVKPDTVFDRSHTVDVTGRPVRVLYFGHSSGPGDIAVFDVDSSVLFAGGLLDSGRVPDLIDGRLPDWQIALAALRALPVRQVMPGHGPVQGPALIDEVSRYLTRLESRVKALLASGAPLSEVPDAAMLPDYERWDQYATLHRRNASLEFLRLELEQMLH